MCGGLRNSEAVKFIAELMGLKSSPALSVINGGLLESNFGLSLSLLREAIKNENFKAVQTDFCLAQNSCS